MSSISGFSSLLEQSSEGLLLLDAEGIILFINEKAASLLGCQPQDLKNRHFKSAFPEKTGLLWKQLIADAGTGHSQSSRTCYLPQTNSWLECVIHPSATGIMLFLKEASAPLSADEKLLKFNRLYQLLSQINQLIVRCQNQETLFREICAIAVSIGQFRMAWIGWLAPTGAIQPITHAGWNDGYLELFPAINQEYGNGPTALALKEGKYVVCQDIETDPRMLPWKDAALTRGYRSSISIPIKKFGYTFGAFNLYADKVNFFDGEEIRLLQEAAGDLSFALEVLEKEALRTRAERSLIESEKRYQTLTDTAPVGIFHTDASGYTTYVNARWCTIAGMEAALAMGDGWLQAVHPEDRAGLESGWHKAIDSHELSTTDYRFIRPDGSIAWVMGRAVPEKNSKDEITGYIGTITEITEIKLFEQSLKHEKALSDSVINSLPGIFYLYDESGRFLRWNKNFEVISGYSEEEIARMHPLDFFAADQKQLLAERIGAVFTSGQSDVEADFLTKTGQRIPHFFTGLAIQFNNQRCLIGSGIDITALKAAEAQREFERQDKEALINTSDDMIWSVDGNLQLIAGNEAFHKAFERITGNRLSPGSKLLQHPALPDSFTSYSRELYQRALEGKKVKEEIYTGKTITPQNSWFELILHPIREDNAVKAIACYARNITESKMYEATLLHVNQKLKTAQQIGNMGYWETDLRSDQIYWTEQAFRIYGIDPEDFAKNNRCFYQQILPEDFERYLQYEQSLRAGKQSEGCEFRIKDASGRIKTLFEIGTPIINDRQEVIKLEGTVQDITERKKAELALQELNTELQELSSHLLIIRDEERKRIGREIHDELGQQLTAIKMDIAWINKKIPETEEMVKEKISNIIGLLDGSNKSIRRILNELRPTVLDDYDLTDALHWQSKLFSNNTGIPIEWTIKNFPTRPREDISNCLFRVFQEALTNITRYAEAKTVFATLQLLNGQIEMIIKDDGKGFVKDSLKKTQSFGLLGIRERVRTVGGRFNLYTAPGEGTMLEIIIPLAT